MPHASSLPIGGRRHEAHASLSVLGEYPLLRDSERNRPIRIGQTGWVPISAMNLAGEPDRPVVNAAHDRARLLHHLNARGYRPVEEVSLADNLTRIDVIGMDRSGFLCGFEIKSEAATLQRLKMQARRYRRYFERLSLVGAEGL